MLNDAAENRAEFQSSLSLCRTFEERIRLFEDYRTAETARWLPQAETQRFRHAREDVASSSPQTETRPQAQSAPAGLPAVAGRDFLGPLARGREPGAGRFS